MESLKNSPQDLETASILFVHLHIRLRTKVNIQYYKLAHTFDR